MQHFGINPVRFVIHAVVHYPPVRCTPRYNSVFSLIDLRLPCGRPQRQRAGGYCFEFLHPTGIRVLFNCQRNSRDGAFRSIGRRYGVRSHVRKITALERFRSINIQGRIVENFAVSGCGIGFCFSFLEESISPAAFPRLSRCLQSNRWSGGVVQITLCYVRGMIPRWNNNSMNQVTQIPNKHWYNNYHIMSSNIRVVNSIIWINIKS